MFWMRNKEDNIFQYTLLSGDLAVLFAKLLINFLPINLILLSTHTICFVLLIIDPDKEI